MSVTINGKTFEGNNLTIRNRTVFIDGKQVMDDYDSRKAYKLPEGRVSIELTGAIGSVNCDESVIVNGTVTGDVNAQGSVTCDDVGRDVHAQGSVSCDDVHGDVAAGGSVSCDDIRGSVQAGGSINR